MMRKESPQSGGSLIEVIIVASILILIIVGIANVYGLLIRSSREVVRATQSALLVEEGLEALRVMRDDRWSTIASSTPGTLYTLAWSGTTWTTTTTPSLVDGVFDRRVSFARVYRDADDKIAPSGSLDTDTYRVDVIVSWNTSSGTTSRTASSYLGNIFE